MPTAKLTTQFVAKASCLEGKSKMEYFDQRQKGFLLEVRASGGKTYYQRYTDDHGLKRQYRIGPADILTLDQAREKGKSILAQVHLGDDPQAKRQEKREILTLAELVRDHYLPHARRTKRSWKTDDTMLRVHILPPLGSKPVDTITVENIAALIQRMTANGYAAGTTNRAIVLLRYIFNLARKWKILGVTDNPTADLTLAHTPHRERHLNAEEMQALHAAVIEDENQVAAQAIWLLLLTGARRNEISHARWDYIDWHGKTLLVPLSKSGKPRRITLNPSALALLKSIAPVPGNPFIFPSPITGKPSSSLHYPWVRIRNRAGLKDMRLHDLRHSFASLLVNKGVPLYTVQKLLGHTQVRTTQRYSHLDDETLSQAVELAGKVIDAEVLW